MFPPRSTSCLSRRHLSWRPAKLRPRYGAGQYLFEKFLRFFARLRESFNTASPADIETTMGPVASGHVGKNHGELPCQQHTGTIHNIFKTYSNPQFLTRRMGSAGDTSLFQSLSSTQMAIISANDPSSGDEK
jgi:hypothetical protein